MSSSKQNNQHSEKDSNESKQNRAALEGGGAGMSVGTTISVIAENALENHPMQPVLTQTAPSIGILISAGWVMAGRWFSKRQDIKNKEIKKKRAEEMVDDALEKIDNEINDPNTSDERKKTLVEKRNEINNIEIDKAIEKIKAVD